MNGPPILEFDLVSKSFGGVPVLKGISFGVPDGHTLGLVGENGAGKSTLMNILGGNHQPEAGQMRLAGQPYAPRHPQDATRHGVAFIHQELNLFGNLSIAENLFLTAFPRSGRLPFIHRALLHQHATALLEQVGLDVPPDTLVEKLSAGEQQLVEIAKALGLEARLIIFDEPTTSLTSQETERLFALLGQLRARGRAVIYISHNLNDVLRLCDDIVVLRDGALVGRGPRVDFTLDGLVTLMVGRSLTQLFPARADTAPASCLGTPASAGSGHMNLCESNGTKTLPDGRGSARGQHGSQPTEPRPSGSVTTCEPANTSAKIDNIPCSMGPSLPAEASVPGAVSGGARMEPLLEVRQLSQPGTVADITFTLHRGEVLGLSGLMGSGRSELARILFGLDPCARGQILLEGQPLRPAPRGNIRRGLAFLTENRREEGLCLEASIADNLALVTLPTHSKGALGWLDRTGLRQAVDTIRRAVRLTPTARDEAPVKLLSGGNQQKVVLAKWLLARPSVFILDEPTRGIDVGAKFEIYQLINGLAAQGAGVLVISSEIEELIGLCDRILVMSRGALRDEVRRAEFDRERILRAALHERTATTALP